LGADGAPDTVSDSTDQVDALSTGLLEEMHAALEYLNQESEPNIGCDCHLSGRSRTFMASDIMPS
jgi:hypothetical protein